MVEQESEELGGVGIEYQAKERSQLGAVIPASPQALSRLPARKKECRNYAEQSAPLIDRFCLSARWNAL